MVLYVAGMCPPNKPSSRSTFLREIERGRVTHWASGAYLIHPILLSIMNSLEPDLHTFVVWHVVKDAVAVTFAAYACALVLWCLVEVRVPLGMHQTFRFASQLMQEEPHMRAPCALQNLLAWEAPHRLARRGA